jgi:hypothetical protein
MTGPRALVPQHIEVRQDPYLLLPTIKELRGYNKHGMSVRAEQISKYRCRT